MPETASDPKTSLPLTPAAFHIMLVLADGENHGYAIMREVAENTQGKMRLGPGSLYGTIKRMLADGWIEETDERPDPQLDDERRRYYRLTELAASWCKLKPSAWSSWSILRAGKSCCATRGLYSYPQEV